MRWIKRFLWVFCALACSSLLLSSVAYAQLTTHQTDVSVNSNDFVTLSFDFSSQTPSPPYQNINFEIFFGANDLSANEGFTIQAFGPSGNAVSNPINIFLTSNSPGAGGGIGSGFGGPVGDFFGSLNTPTGYLAISNVIGSFDLTGAWVLAANLNTFPPGTNWINVSSIVVAPIPEPETYAMLLAGLGLLGFAASRKTIIDLAKFLYPLGTL